jgi:hypothetical protein
MEYKPQADEAKGPRTIEDFIEHYRKNEKE